jgi:hypothetical protein
MSFREASYVSFLASVSIADAYFPSYLPLFLEHWWSYIYIYIRARARVCPMLLTSETIDSLS